VNAQHGVGEAGPELELGGHQAPDFRHREPGSLPDLSTPEDARRCFSFLENLVVDLVDRRVVLEPGAHVHGPRPAVPAYIGRLNCCWTRAKLWAGHKETCIGDPSLLRRHCQFQRIFWGPAPGHPAESEQLATDKKKKPS